MAKVSKEVASDLMNAVKQVSNKMKASDKVDNSSKSDVKIQKGITDTLEVENSLFEALDIEEESKSREPSPRTHEETCERDLRLAAEKNLPEPEFDFRNQYSSGDRVHFVKVIPSLGVKEIYVLTLRSIYPRMMIGYEEKGKCQCIGYAQRDSIFDSPKEANKYYKSIKITDVTGSNEPEEESLNQ